MRHIRIIFIIPILVSISLACSLPGLSSLSATDTPVPTNTMAPSQTALPSSTAVSVPTLASVPTLVSTVSIPSSANTQSGNDDLLVIADKSYTVDTWNYIVGIVKNNTDKTIEWMEMSVLIYDQAGKLIATEKMYPYLDKLAPGETSPFSVYSDSWDGFSTYQFLIEDYQNAEEPVPAGLEILSHSSYSDEYYLNLVGEIKNNSDKPMSYVKIVAALYAADGTLVNTNYSYAMVNSIAPGGKSPFKIWFSDAWEDGDNYEIQVQGSFDEYSVAQTVTVTDFAVAKGDGSCTVTGNVKNTGSAEIPFVTVIASFYDASNTLLEAEWNYTTGDAIPGGTSVPFSITTYSCPEFDHIEVYAGN